MSKKIVMSLLLLSTVNLFGDDGADDFALVDFDVVPSHSSSEVSGQKGPNYLDRKKQDVYNRAQGAADRASAKVADKVEKKIDVGIDAAFDKAGQAAENAWIAFWNWVVSKNKQEEASFKVESE